MADEQTFLRDGDYSLFIHKQCYMFISGLKTCIKLNLKPVKKKCPQIGLCYNTVCVSVWERYSRRGYRWRSGECGLPPSQRSQVRWGMANRIGCLTRKRDGVNQVSHLEFSMMLLYLNGLKSYAFDMDEQEISECKYLHKESIAFIGVGSINSSGSSGGNKSSGLGSKAENGFSGHGSVAASLLNSMANSFTGRGSKQPDTLNITTLLCSNQYTTDGQTKI
ncbi:hypothetical protein ACTXT7_013590 [Hymenolepis weldensis]